MAEPVPPSPRGSLTRSIAGWVTRPFASTSLPIAWLGLGIAVGYVALHWAFDLVFQLTIGFPEGVSPAWRAELWWPDLVNAALTGYVPAALAYSRRGVLRDLDDLRPRLRLDDAGFAALRRAMTGPGGPLALALSILGLVCGVGLVLVDPSVAAGATPSLSNPAFIWAVVRSVIFLWLVACLIATDFGTTRAYNRVGREGVAVDLLDVGGLSAFARRGQRSALIWVLFLTLFSLFWIGDNASRNNVYLLVLALTMATLAFAWPLIGVHQNILAVKREELERVRDAIRAERSGAFTADASPRLANLVAWYQLIEGAREWPVDAGNLLRVLAYLVLGLGSWLGGALVERILNAALPG